MNAYVAQYFCWQANSPNQGGNKYHYCSQWLEKLINLNILLVKTYTVTQYKKYGRCSMFGSMCTVLLHSSWPASKCMSSLLIVWLAGAFCCIFPRKKLTLNLTLHVVPCGVREGEEVQCQVFMRTAQRLDSKSVFCCSLNTSCMPSDQRVNKPNTKYRADLRQL